jgi:hypothetical protein
MWLGWEDNGAYRILVGKCWKTSNLKTKKENEMYLWEICLKMGDGWNWLRIMSNGEF